MSNVEYSRPAPAYHLWIPAAFRFLSRDGNPKLPMFPWSLGLKSVIYQIFIECELRQELCTVLRYNLGKSH